MSNRVSTILSVGGAVHPMSCECHNRCYSPLQHSISASVSLLAEPASAARASRVPADIPLPTCRRIDSTLIGIGRPFDYQPSHATSIEPTSSAQQLQQQQQQLTCLFAGWPSYRHVSSHRVLNETLETTNRPAPVFVRGLLNIRE